MSMIMIMINYVYIICMSTCLDKPKEWKSANITKTRECQSHDQKIRPCCQMLPGYVQALSSAPFNTICGRHAFADEVNAQTHLTWMGGTSTRPNGSNESNELWIQWIQWIVDQSNLYKSHKYS